jgi:galactonate dehydratase
MAGIDQALWDIKGKQQGEPVYEMLGGASRDRIRLYQWAGGDRPKDIATEANRLVEAGYTAIKMDASDPLEQIARPAAIEHIVDRIEIVRETVGMDIDIGVDFRGRISKTEAKRLLDEIEQYQLLFVEEPVLPENSHLLGDISHQTTVPIAAGERLYTRWDYRPLFEENSINVVQPNVSHAGGISEVVNIARMAETYDVVVSPNCTTGPIALAASLQVASHVPNFLIQDQGFKRQNTEDAYNYLRNPDVLDTEDGHTGLLSEPGLGIQVNEAEVRKHAKKESVWDYPVWRLDDGSVTDW